jgi:hypothetical protein
MESFYLLCYYIGILIVFGSHGYTIFTSENKDMLNLSYLNIFAAVLIAIYFMNKECFFGCDTDSNRVHDRDCNRHAEKYH